jgi:HlyD family secretion protein
MEKKSFGWLRWLIGLVVTAALLGGGYWYFVGRDGSAPQYQTAPVTRGDLIQVVTATGQLNPVINVQIGSQISGRIKAIYVDFNSVVKSNEMIAEIDAATYQVAVLKAEAQLSNAVANLALADVQARRAGSLFRERLIADADHDTAIAQLLQAQAQVRSDQANLESANVDLSRCKIYAPVDGVVITRAVDVGQTVAASFNTPTLFLIANDLSRMQIDALVSEADIGGVEVGQNVNFTVDAYPYRTFHGKIVQIRYGASTNQNVVNYDTVVAVSNSDLKLMPSMTANASIIIAERESVLKIPNAALRFRPPDTGAPKTNATPSNATNAINVSEGRRGEGEPGARGGGFRQGGPGGGPGGGGFRGSNGGGPGGAGRGFGAGGGARPERAGPRTVYILNATKDPAHPELTPVRIRTGINDGVSTEVVEGLKEGDMVVTALIAQEDDSSAQRPVNPFSSGGPGGRRRF